ncbi:BnaC04g03510D [Brassica napus]|uniref:BnaC04g03510D protein n=1 Tax=Brassica napus TaxID=3708 RepID=A0A078FZQ7_BRANA|nr:BnaC04g03510D [Brassica napus]
MKMSRLSDAITGGRQAAAVLPTWVGGRARTDDRGDNLSLCIWKRPARKSIKSEDGDIIDCVPIHSQPAFDHPLLKNHTIQMRPSFIPESTSMYTKTNPTQVWHKNGRCPENTVPIRRTKKEDILRSKIIRRVFL